MYTGALASAHIENAHVSFRHIRSLHKDSSICKSFLARLHPFLAILEMQMLCLFDPASQHRIAAQGHHMVRAQHATAAAQGPRATHGGHARCRCSTSSRRGRFGSSPHRLAAICPGAVLFMSKHQTRPQSKQTN